MLEELNSLYKENFSKSDNKIMDALFRNKSELQYITTEELSKNLGISQPTISRFWNKIGFKNLKEFKLYIRNNSNTFTPSSKILVALNEWKKNDEYIHNMTLEYSDHIVKTLEHLTPSILQKSAQSIIAAKHIYIFAPDASIGVAEILNYRLNRFGIKIILMKSGSQLYESMINLNKDDLVILFGYSRLISEIIILLKHSKIANYKTILFTDLLTQQELNYADIVMYNYRGEPSQYHSMVSSIALIDLLVIKIAQLKEDSLDKMKTLENIREQYSYLIKR